MQEIYITRVIEFSKNNSIPVEFVLNVMLTAAELNNTVGVQLWNDTSMITAKITMDEKQAMARAIDQQMKNNPAIAEEYSRPVNNLDLVKLPANVKSKLTVVPPQWKIKDLVLYSTYIQWYDAIYNKNSINLILQHFGKQIIEISNPNGIAEFKKQISAIAHTVQTT